MPITLNKLLKDQSGIITDLTGKQSFIARATAIGFSPGVEIIAIQNIKGYPLIVYLNDTRIVIDRDEARKVIIDAS